MGTMSNRRMQQLRRRNQSAAATPKRSTHAMWCYARGGGLCDCGFTPGSIERTMEDYQRGLKIERVEATGTNLRGEGKWD